MHAVFWLWAPHFAWQRLVLAASTAVPLGAHRCMRMAIVALAKYLLDYTITVKFYHYDKLIYIYKNIMQYYFYI